MRIQGMITQLEVEMSITSKKHFITILYKLTYIYEVELMVAYDCRLYLCLTTDLEFFINIVIIASLPYENIHSCNICFDRADKTLFTGHYCKCTEEAKYPWQ